MGFLDSVKKGLGDVAQSVNQAVNKSGDGAGERSPGSAGPGGSAHDR